MAFKYFTSVAIFMVFTMLILVGIESKPLLSETSGSATTDLSGGEQNNPQNTDQQGIGSDEYMQIEIYKQNAIINATKEFAEKLAICELIVESVHKVSDFVPAFKNPQQSEFWQNKIIPVMIRALEQHVMAQSVITKVYGTVRDLSIIIQSAYDIIIRTKSNKIGVEIAKRQIGSALNRLNESIILADHLRSDALISFSNETEKIFTIQGQEEAKSWAEQKVDLDNKIRDHRNSQQNLISRLGEKKGKVERLYYLIAMQEKRLNATEDEIEATKERTKELNRLNDQIDSTIQNIPHEIKKTATESVSCNWWFWRIDWTKTHTLHVDSPRRESDRKYYDAIIKSRVARIMANNQDQNYKKNEFDKLKRNKADYMLEYSKAKVELESLQTSLHENLNKEEQEIEKLLGEKTKVEEIARLTSEKIGLKGTTLIDCLAQLRNFSRSLTPTGSAYAQLPSILRSIHAMVNGKIELLSSDQPSLMPLAVTMVIEQVKFLSKYTVLAQDIMAKTKISLNTKG